MTNQSKKIIDDLIQRYPELETCKQEIIRSSEVLVACYKNGHKVLVCGNGGSAADSLHIVGELMKSFVVKRPIMGLKKEKLEQCQHADFLIDSLETALPAIALVDEISLITAYSNDKCPDLCFAQQVLGYGQEGDVLIGISTSGNSANVVYACEVAKALGLEIIILSGNSGGKLANYPSIKVNETETYKIQEYHLPIYHCLCMVIESELFL